jgi:hypothetical protein
MRTAAAFVTAAVLTTTFVEAFYLPGIAPKSYALDEDLPIYVNALESPRSTLPYDFYNERFHFCQPEGGPQRQGESLGSVLMGDRLYTSPFQVRFRSLGFASSCFGRSSFVRMILWRAESFVRLSRFLVMMLFSLTIVLRKNTN